MTLNENLRVKILALLHLTRLGYTYIPEKEYHGRKEKNLREYVDYKAF